MSLGLNQFSSLRLKECSTCVTTSTRPNCQGWVEIREGIRESNGTECNPQSKPSHTLTVSMHVTPTQLSSSLNHVAVLVLPIRQAARCALLGTIPNPDRHGEFSAHPLGTTREAKTIPIQASSTERMNCKCLDHLVVF